ncbi:MAG: PEP-CTERM sorting domain-containing protein [Burkholderiales bacterium]|nr:PEP-CTERM sorting domain-containing protein [Burkholderiales bacterium]
MRLTTLASATALLGGLMLTAGPASAAATIYFTGGGAFTAGSSVSVDVMVGNLPAGEAVTAFDIDVGYDGTMLSFFDVFFDVQLGDSLLGEAIEGATGSSPGLVDLFSLSLLTDAELVALQAGGPVHLASLQFTALTDGDTSGMSFMNWGPFNDVKGVGNKILIGQVPEPASFGLAALALLGLGLTRRRA